ncbi:MAG: gamma carbonic anhydrase family protein, partial [Bacteroidia bacterium]|nr:gamma carbonic anhydrase family protein [Bacteroidia bacterium]
MGPLIRSVRGFTPQIHPTVFLAETAVVIGDVVIGPESSVWYNVVIRGDVHSIRIGSRSNIQDGAVVHCTYQKAKTDIGNNVTVGHGAIVHGCTLHDFVLIGMGAKVLDHAVVESESVVAAGSVVLERTVVESGWLYAGVPAKKVKR